MLAVGVGVMMLVTTMVATPAEPEDMLVATEVKGTGGETETASGVTDGWREPADVAGLTEVAVGDMGEPPFPPGPEVARPEMVARLGAVEA